jgi:flagella basal body P-ring formation protein FlgA
MTPAGPVARIIHALTLAAVIAVIAPAFALAQMTPQVKPNVEVTGDYVLLGDLFIHAGAAAQVAVFRAPAPGGSGTVNAERLARVAKGHGLDWDNPRNIGQVQVSRAGLLIAEDELRDMIAGTLKKRIASSINGRTFDVTFTTDQPELYVAADKLPAAEVVQLRYSRRSGRFTAVIAAPAGDPAARRYNYSGRAVEVSSIAVPVHNMRRGAVITEHDVEMRNIPVRRIDSTTMTEMPDLIGMAAKRSLRAGEPVRTRDIEHPQIVRKNGEVTLQYKGPGLVLTVRGTALQSGAMGDIINIRNATSNRIIQGRIIGPELVEAAVGGARKLAQAN